MSPGSSTDSYPAFASYWVEGKPSNMSRPGIEPVSPGFTARRARRYSTGPQGTELEDHRWSADHSLRNTALDHWITVASAEDLVVNVVAVAHELKEIRGMFAIGQAFNDYEMQRLYRMSITH
ncbi:hypothetical protein ANN_23415 [Periplaneta americana]|uniref:Uncharacterized protein n=1 Tax=Periplaneta americana TaxID=6978 RepID=A0ABQ8SL14_PERAM|nr:hypothetical protein ANN_23415 [Periplaneta americana]